jgi:hypothetical protein
MLKGRRKQYTSTRMIGATLHDRWLFIGPWPSNIKPTTRSPTLKTKSQIFFLVNIGPAFLKINSLNYF